jgi:UDP-N-acetylglucosamine transferase subunit ALG13
MIFVTVGTQEPFDRLIKTVDEFSPFWRGEEVVAQTGNGSYSVKNINAINYLDPDEYADLFNRARLVICHAGTGTILSALMKKKPIAVLARKASLGEHRNEHQLATARRFSQLGYIKYIEDEMQLSSILSFKDDYGFLLPTVETSDMDGTDLVADIRLYLSENLL